MLSFALTIWHFSDLQQRSFTKKRFPTEESKNKDNEISSHENSWDIDFELKTNNRFFGRDNSKQLLPLLQY